MPTLTELLASAKKGKKSLKDSKPKWGEEPIAKFHFSVSEDNPYMLDPYAISVDHLELDLHISPATSLSSFAGSGSEDKDDGVNGQALYRFLSVVFQSIRHLYSTLEPST